MPRASLRSPACLPGEYRLHVFHERAFAEVLRALERNVTVGGGEVTLPAMAISDAGYITPPHKNKYGKDYPAIIVDQYPGRAGGNDSRFSLLPKIYLSTAVAVTTLFAAAGWFFVRQASAALHDGVEQEVRSSLATVDASWQSRAEHLSTASVLLASMADVRSAFGTRDRRHHSRYRRRDVGARAGRA